MSIVESTIQNNLGTAKTPHATFIDICKVTVCSFPLKHTLGINAMEDLKCYLTVRSSIVPQTGKTLSKTIFL